MNHSKLLTVAFMAGILVVCCLFGMLYYYAAPYLGRY